MATREPMVIHQATSVQARATCGPTAATAIRYLVHQVPGPSHKISYRQLPSRRQGSLPHMQASLSIRLHRAHTYRQECQASLPGPVNTPSIPGAPRSATAPPAAAHECLVHQVPSPCTRQDPCRIPAEPSACTAARRHHNQWPAAAADHLSRRRLTSLLLCALVLSPTLSSARADTHTRSMHGHMHNANTLLSRILPVVSLHTSCCTQDSADDSQAEPRPCKEGTWCTRFSDVYSDTW